MSQSQALRVLAYMVEHDGITSLTAAKKLNITSLHRRLFDLKLMGVPIDAKAHPTSNCKIYRPKFIPKHVRKQLDAMKKAEVCA